MAAAIDYPFTVRRLEPDEGGGFLVEFPDLPGCIADGETIDEALREAEDALRSWLRTRAELGHAVPEPARFSGHWRIRMPRSLHRRLADRARAEGVSLNTLAVTLLAEATGSPEPATRATRPRPARAKPKRSGTAA